MHNILKRLELQAIDRFREEGLRVGLSMKDIDNSIQGLRSSGNQTQESVLIELLTTLIARKLIDDLQASSSLVRALQGLANHLVIHESDEPTSAMLEIVREATIEDGRNVLPDFTLFFGLLADAHEQIGLFFAQSSIEHPECLRSVAHHILDWLTQENPFSMHNASAQKLATIALAVMKNVNLKIDNDLPLIPKELATFGGWTGPGALQSTAIRATSDVLSGVHDPTLLVPNPETQVEGWEERLSSFGLEVSEDEDTTGSIEDSLFDDCPACQAQKDALLTGKPLQEKDLLAAFKKMNGSTDL